MSEGLVFDLQRFSIHDGPGIRTTVFLKGCPLSCLWCHNPEGQEARPEVFFSADKCIGCGRCVLPAHCEAIEMVDGKAVVDPEECIGCGVCIRQCPHAIYVLQSDHAVINEQNLDRCIRDRTCVRSCPTGAIAIIERREDDARTLDTGPTTA